MRAGAMLGAGRIAVRIDRLGPLPLVNHILDRLGLPALFAQHVPTPPARCALPFAMGLGVLLRSIIVEREPIYRQRELVRAFTPEGFGLAPAAAAALRDDQLGRALDALFAADRGTLLTATVVAAVRQFGVRLAELHNDSTTVMSESAAPVQYCSRFPSWSARAAIARALAGWGLVQSPRGPVASESYLRHHFWHADVPKACHNQFSEPRGLRTDARLRLRERCRLHRGSRCDSSLLSIQYVASARWRATAPIAFWCPLRW